MQFKQNHARPVVLRELSLLRALGASLRISSYRLRKPGYRSLPLTVLPPPDRFALGPHQRSAGPLAPDEGS
jgi:hypothetical protein